MLPRLACHQFADCAGPNAVFATERTITPSGARLYQDGACLTFGEFRVMGAFTVRMAALVDHILCILFRRSGEKMRGIDTSRRIAGVTDLLTFWDRTIGQLISEDMSKDRALAPIEPTIALGVRPSLPKPTITDRLSTRPKFPDALWRTGFALAGAILGYSRMSAREVAAAGDTDQGDWDILPMCHLSLLTRLGWCHAPGRSQRRRGFVLFANYTIAAGGGDGLPLSEAALVASVTGFPAGVAG